MNGYFRFYFRYLLVLATAFSGFSLIFVNQSRAAAASLRAMVAHHAAAQGVPAGLAHAVVVLESRYRPNVVSKGNYVLMQIRLGTARAMGFRGSPRQLLQPDTNLRFGMKYLARAWRGSRGNVCGAIKRYQTGTGTGRMSHATLTYCARAQKLMANR